MGDRESWKKIDRSIIEVASQTTERALWEWQVELEEQHPKLIALLDGSKNYEEAMARLDGLTLEELLTL